LKKLMTDTRQNREELFTSLSPPGDAPAGFTSNTMKRVTSSPAVSNMAERKEYLDKLQVKRKKAAMKKSKSAANFSKIRLEFQKLAKATPMIAQMGISARVQSYRRLTLAKAQSGEDIQLLEQQFQQEDSFTWPLIIAITHGVVGAFSYGYNATYLNTIQKKVQSDCCGSTVVTDNLFGVITGMYVAGGLVGALSGGKLADRTGRRPFLLAMDVVTILGSIIFYIQYKTHSLGIYLLGRFVVGIGVGAGSAVCNTYLGEISPPSIRGAVGTIFQAVLCFGCLMGYVISHPLQNYYWIVNLLSAVPPVLQLLLAGWFPETPVWLYSRWKDADAQATLQKLRGYEDVTFEMETYSRACKNTKVADDQLAPLIDREDNPPKPSLCGTKSIRWALIISCAMAVIQQLAGINALICYSAQIFSEAGFDNAYMANIILGTVNFVGVLIAVPLMDRLGRRVLILFSCSLMFVACCVISYTFKMAQEPGAKLIWGQLTVAIGMVYILGFELGMGPIPWLIVAEVSPTSHRAFIMSLAAGINWACNLIITFGWNPVSKALGYQVWWIFCAVLLFGIVFVALKVPETKGLLPDEVQQILAGNTGSSDDFISVQKLHATPPVSGARPPTRRGERGDLRV